MASACHFHGAGIVTGCDDICAKMEASCALVILSKFGQLEALRRGVMDVFERSIPIMTAVSPVYAKASDDFTASLGVLVPSEDNALDGCWREISKGEFL
jgi:hypothetical protein